MASTSAHRAEMIRLIRRGQVRSWAWTAFIDALLIWCGAGAARDGSWTVCALISGSVVLLTGFNLWLDKAAIYLDGAGQPLTGQDADRLARKRLRAYEKHRKNCPGCPRG